MSSFPEPDRPIDLNSDVGEGGDDEPLYALITTANVACGGHAGDERTMHRAVSLALRHGVAIGAHPSYPDRKGFGRATKDLPPKELARSIAEQVSALRQVALDLGARMDHVKPHGALYNDATLRRDIALAVAEGVGSVSSALILVGLAGCPALAIWRELGFQVAAEGFADRAYAENGGLVSRAVAGALITDPGVASAQAIRLATTGGCDTICVHSDTPGAAAILARVRHDLETSGFTLRSVAGRKNRT